MVWTIIFKSDISAKLIQSDNHDTCGTHVSMLGHTNLIFLHISCPGLGLTKAQCQGTGSEWKSHPWPGHAEITQPAGCWPSPSSAGPWLAETGNTGLWLAHTDPALATAFLAGLTWRKYYSIQNTGRSHSKQVGLNMTPTQIRSDLISNIQKYVRIKKLFWQCHANTFLS